VRPCDRGGLGVSPGNDITVHHLTSTFMSLYPLCGWQVTTKEVRCDLVTEVDRECEALITKAVTRTFPLHKVIGEETATEEALAMLEEGAMGPYDWVWIIDPIDGTLQLCRAPPLHCICAVHTVTVCEHCTGVQCVYSDNEPKEPHSSPCPSVLLCWFRTQCCSINKYVCALCLLCYRKVGGIPMCAVSVGVARAAQWKSPQCMTPSPMSSSAPEEGGAYLNGKLLRTPAAPPRPTSSWRTLRWPSASPPRSVTSHKSHVTSHTSHVASHECTSHKSQVAPSGCKGQPFQGSLQSLQFFFFSPFWLCLMYSSVLSLSSPFSMSLLGGVCRQRSVRGCSQGHGSCGPPCPHHASLWIRCTCRLHTRRLPPCCSLCSNVVLFYCLPPGFVAQKHSQKVQYRTEYSTVVCIL